MFIKGGNKHEEDLKKNRGYFISALKVEQPKFGIENFTGMPFNNFFTTKSTSSLSLLAPVFYDMHSSAKSAYHFQIADSSGKSVVVEYINNKISIVKANKTYQMATNFLITKSHYNFGHGQDRYEKMKKILDQNNIH